MKPSFMERIQALGAVKFFSEAKPDEIAEGLAELSTSGAKDGKSVKDEDEDAKKAAKKEEEEREAKDSKRKAARDAAEHPAKCMCDDCMDSRGSKDKEELGEDEMTDADKLEEEEKKDKEEKGGKDESALILPADEHSKSEFSTGDTAKHLLTLKPIIAKHGDRAAKDALNTLCKGIRQVKAGVKDSATDPFVLLTNITSADAMADNEPEEPMFKFFNGKSHADGLKAWNEYLDRRAARRRA